ncbi:MAG: nucleotidyltransferase domain-containing protein [Burkholderiales bacterium]|nr:nucleotidyltransferase domain-containing protein [Burkholderiales bacterium]
MNTAFERDRAIRAMIAGVLRAHAHRLRGYKVVLFGSRASGRARLRSDYDLGVLGAKPLPLEDFYAIEDALEDLPTLYRIDWVDLMRVSDRFRARALAQAEVLYE